MFSGKQIGTPGRILGLVLAYNVFVFSLPGCSLPRKSLEKTVVVTVTETKDSIIIRDRIIHDTIKVDVPVYVEKNVTQDDSSHLENPFAVSDAWIKDGLLYHNLRTRGQMEVPVEIPVSETTAVHNENNTATHTETVYVEKDLTMWQKVRLRAFWWLILTICGLLGWIFRKPLLNLIL